MKNLNSTYHKNKNKTKQKTKKQKTKKERKKQASLLPRGCTTYYVFVYMSTSLCTCKYGWYVK